MTPKRVAWVAAVTAVIYVGVAVFILSNFDLPEMSGFVFGLVGLAAVSQIGAKWFFGLLFRESVEEAGGTLRLYLAFKAALVGAGVARLIPAGGAITPVAMAWTVRNESKFTFGAALRTVLLNYAGLLMLAGAGLLLARPRESVQFASVSLVVLAPFAILLGVVLMFGSGRLGSVYRYLPKFIKKRMETTMVNHMPALESQLYVWARLVLEATALGLVLIAFGVEVNPLQVAAAYGVGQLVGGLPGTPGGIGLTEVGLVFILTAYGFAAPTTVAPVLIFRLISYWLPAGLGLLAGGMTFLRSDEAKAASSAA